MFSFDHLREVVEEGYRSTSAALDTPQEWPQPGDVGVYPKRGVVVRVQRERCIGCGACLLQAPPGMFVLDAQGKAVVTRPEQERSPIDGEFIRHCPTYAISARPVAAPAGSSGSTRIPVSPSRTASGTPPERPPTTASPHADASTSAMPKPSASRS